MIVCEMTHQIKEPSSKKKKIDCHLTDVLLNIYRLVVKIARACV